MPASISRSAVRLAAAILLLMLVGGCAGEADEPSTAAAASTTTVAPTTTTLPPLTAKELAWLKAIPTVTRKIEKSIEAISDLTPAGMARLANTFRSCTRELVRGGSPSERLQPVYVLVRKACKEYDKGAACFATAASVGIPFAGTPGEQKQSKALDCGFAAPGRPASPSPTLRARGRRSKQRLADAAILGGAQVTATNGPQPSDPSGAHDPRSKLRPPPCGCEGETGSPVTVGSLPGRRAAGGRPQGRP
jgi:hypothetical protein